MMSCSVVVVVVVAALAVKNGQALVGFPQTGGMYGSQYGFQQQVNIASNLHNATFIVTVFCIYSHLCSQIHLHNATFIVTFFCI